MIDTGDDGFPVAKYCDFIAAVLRWWVVGIDDGNDNI